MKIVVPRADEVGPLLRKVRRAAKIRQEEVALTAGCTVKFLVDLEAGKATSPIAKVFDVAHALGVRILLDLPEERADHA